MRCGMTIRGEECFKEILSKNDKHIPRLVIIYDNMLYFSI